MQIYNPSKTQLVPPGLLDQADKILFVAHLALGDFTYLQNCFRAFAQAYPHIKMHLWVDELRRTDDPQQWETLRQYSLYDWVRESGLFDKLYTQTYSPVLFEQSVTDAQAESYPIIISLAVLHRHTYVELMRRLSPDGFIVGQKKRPALWDIPKHLIYRKLDASIPAYNARRVARAGKGPVPHISAIYAGWFQQLFGLVLSEADRFPFVDIPPRWTDYARQLFRDVNFDMAKPTVFLNGFSKAPERSWDLTKVIGLVKAMQELDGWSEANFIINVIPEQLAQSRSTYQDLTSGKTIFFGADSHFFQLPAVLSLCTLIISVETAVMHLANAVNVPVIALMRQTSPEWVPINAAISTVIKTAQRKDWVDQISIRRVVDEIKKTNLIPTVL